jgi:YcxB-like protein
MAMRCEYIFTYKDFLDAMKAYRKVSRRAAIGYWLYVWILPVVGLAVGIVSLVAYLRQDGEIFWVLFWPACIGLGFAFGFPARYRIGIRRAFDQRNALAKGKPMYCEFDDSTVRFIVPDGTEVSYPWGSLTDFVENDRVAVLFIGQAAFHTVPKRAMDEDGWAQFRQLVDRHVKRA